MRNVLGKFVEKIKIYFKFNKFFLIVPLMRYVEKYGRARQATDDITQHMRIVYWITKATDTHLDVTRTPIKVTRTPLKVTRTPLKVTRTPLKVMFIRTLSVLLFWL
jgi:hypothetical protein